MADDDELTTEQRAAWSRYERAVALTDQIRAEWVAAGSPLTSLGGHSGLVLKPHPLVELLQRAERDASMFLRVCRPRGREGRPVGHNTSPDRQPGRRGKLKAVT